MKQFYACIDSFFPAPQPEQHQAIKRMALREQGEIIFYGAEEYRFAHLQNFIIHKLKRTNNVNGVIFFTLNQFCYAESFNLKILMQIFDIGLSIHFAREDLSYAHPDAFLEYFYVVAAHFHGLKRRQKPKEIPCIFDVD